MQCIFVYVCSDDLRSINKSGYLYSSRQESSFKDLVSDSHYKQDVCQVAADHAAIKLVVFQCDGTKFETESGYKRVTMLKCWLVYISGISTK